MSRRARLAYLCLQATTEGQASHAHVHEIIAGLERRGFTVDLFEPAYAGKASPGALGRLVEFSRVQRALKRALRSGEYDALYVRGHALAWPTARAAARLGVPTIQECNGPYADLYAAWPSARAFRPVLDAMTRWQFARAAAVIAVTPELADWVSREAHRDSDVIGNGANTSLFSPSARSAITESLPARYAVYFGALTQWQRIDVMLGAAEDPQWPEDVSLVVVGDGMLAPEVAEASGRNPRVVGLGRIPYGDVGGVVARAMCSLVLSDERTGSGVSPIKLYESMACGVPVVVTDTAGAASTVREFRCGIVVERAHAEEVARAVARITADPDASREMGHAGVAAVAEHFSWDVRAGQTAEVIERVVRSEP